MEHVVTYGGIWISIHAPLTGSDAYTFQTLRFGYEFQSTLLTGATDEKFGEFLNNFISIHAPLTGSDSQREGVKVTVTVFQSTLPSQGATVVDAFMRMAFGDFNPRSPHRERLLAIVKYFRRRNFNPRLPWWATQLIDGSKKSRGIFNPRSPHRSDCFDHCEF